MTCCLRNWTFPGIISKEVTDTFLFRLIFFASYASGIPRSYVNLFLYTFHAHSYISVRLLRSETCVFDVCLAIWYSFIPEKCCVPFLRYVVKT